MNSHAIDISKFKEIETGEQPVSNTNCNIEPGVYDISIEAYHSSSGISRSGIMEFTKTPFHYYSHYIKPGLKKEVISQSLKIGNALHNFVLEPDEFMNRYIVVEKRDRRTKEGKQYYELIELNRGTKEVIDEDQFSIIKKMYDSLHSNAKIHDLITGAQYEKSIYWTDPHTGLLCKCRPDIWQPGFIIDLKSTSSASYRDFQRSLFSYGYHIQCAMIHEAFKNLLGIIVKDFVFIVIENTEPFACAIYKLDEYALEKSIETFKNKLIEIKECFEKDEWPSYKTQIITLPTYAENNS